MRQYLFLHVIIAVLQRKLQRPLAVACVYEVRRAAHELLALFKPCHVVVADYIACLRLLHAALYAAKVEEAFVAFRVLRPLKRGQKRVELLKNVYGIDHFVLRPAGVYVLAVNKHLCACGVEVFVFYFAYRAAVNGVCKVRIEALHVEKRGPVAYLLVRREAYGYPAVAYGLILYERFGHCHYLRNARLVVRAKHRCAVRNYQILPLQLLHVRENIRAYADGIVQPYAAAVVVFNYAGAYALLSRPFNGIHMRNEAERGQACIRCGYEAVYIAMLIQPDVLKAHLPHFRLYHAGKVELLLRAGDALHAVRRARIHLDIAQEAFGYIR